MNCSPFGSGTRRTSLSEWGVCPVQTSKRDLIGQACGGAPPHRFVCDVEKPSRRLVEPSRLVPRGREAAFLRSTLSEVTSSWTVKTEPLNLLICCDG
jgi:hypothetical protein